MNRVNAATTTLRTIQEVKPNTFIFAQANALSASLCQQMIERFDGAYALALAAYNAGPHRVDRWLKSYGDPRSGDIPLTYWIESIPFSETRNYVQRVLEGLFVYRARRGGNGGWVAAAPTGGT